MSQERALQVSERIRTAMVLAHKTQADVATVIGLGQDGVSKRLSGKIAWRAEEIMQIAPYLGVRAGYLLGEGPVL